MFSIEELNVMRQSLDVITITGRDAQFIAQLQTKLDLIIKEFVVPKTSATKSDKTKS
jgi:hypothetical protein